MKKLPILLLALSLAACAPVGAARTPQPTETNTLIPTQTHTPLPTSTSTTTFTPTPTHTPTFTPSPTNTLTPTPVTAELRAQILETYRMIVMVQVDAEYLNETAQKVKSKELRGFQEAVVIMILVNLVDAVEKNIPNITPPDILKSYWKDTRSVHEQAKDILSRWLGKKIMSGDVLLEMEPVLKQMAQVAGDAEEALARKYGFDPSLLSAQRQEVLDLVQGLLGIPTPATAP